MTDRGKLEVLFLCTGNSARSILAEYLLCSMDGRFATYSAGAAPTGRVHPMAEKVLREAYGVDAGDAESKSWESLSHVDFDIVITVCDHARDSCPLWPGSAAVRAHWGSPDPAAVSGSDADVEAAFRQVARQIHSRLAQLCALPVERLARSELAARLHAIGSEHVASAGVEEE